MTSAGTIGGTANISSAAKDVRRRQREAFSKKDRPRHEAKHNPGFTCEWEGCRRVFSRGINMRDHVKRIHLGKKGR